jgi:putative phosphoesterase
MDSPTKPLRRVGLLGDIHCEDEALALALEHFATQTLDAVLSVGDIVDGHHGDANRTCALLAAHGVACVAGNHDRWAVQGTFRDLPEATRDLTSDSLAFLAELPRTRVYPTVRGPLLLCHGLGDDDLAGVKPDDHGYALESNWPLWALVVEPEYRFILNGHTHQAMIRRIRDVTLINAGTLHRAFQPMCCIVDFEEAKLHLHEITQTSVTLTQTLDFPVTNEA